MLEYRAMQLWRYAILNGRPLRPEFEVKPYIAQMFHYYGGKSTPETTLTHEETSETSQTTNITGGTYLKQTDGKESYATAYLSDRREPRSSKGITGRTTSRQHCQATLSHVTAASTAFVT